MFEHSYFLYVLNQYYSCHFFAGEFLLRIFSWNISICDAVLAKMTSFSTTASKSDPFALFDYLILYDPEEHAVFKKTLSLITSGMM